MFAKCAAGAAYCLMSAVIPAQASGACLTKPEARQMFRTSHLYWHGKDHCWDASPVAARRASIAYSLRHRDTGKLPALTARPPNAVAKTDTPPTPANSGQLQQASVLPELRQWSNTMAMAGSVETTPWTDRWPDQPIKPPSRPAITEAAANAALVTSRGMVAGIMIFVLSLAIFEVLFGGRNLRTRLRSVRKGAVSPSSRAATRWPSRHRI
jgi:hypothetical protein